MQTDPFSQPYDVVVIGGGVVGCTAAFSLIERGLKVAVVERERVAGGTTSRSFAWINATSKTNDADYHRLNALGGEGYRELATRFGEERIGLHRDGMLHWCRAGDAARLATLRERFERLGELGYPVAWVGPGQLAAMEPHVDFPDDAEALYALADPWLDAPTFVRFLVDEIRAAGSMVLEGCEATALAMDDDARIEGVETGDGTLATGRVLIAAGPGTPETLAALTGFDAFATRFPMQTSAGLLVTTPSTAPRRLVRHILYFDDTRDLHVRAAPGGGLRLGADDTDGMIVEDDSEAGVRRAALELLRRTRSFIPGFAGEACIDECRLDIGIRPMPEDGRTLAGRLPGTEDLYVVATHSGITLSPVIGPAIAEAIETGETPAVLEPFSLARFQRFA